MKRLIIGDIHGCYDELGRLLKKANLNTEDEVIALGDLLDRGPDSLKVMTYFIEKNNRKILLGNHEKKHVKIANQTLNPSFSQLITLRQINNDYYSKIISFLEGCPLFLEYPEAILVHGYVEPNMPLKQQRENVLLGTLGGEKYLSQNYDSPWYELYERDKPIIVGHKEYLGNGEPFIYKDKVYCLDTGCVHGRNLTGLLLPDFELISVKSKKNYWHEIKSGLPELKLLVKSETSLEWKEIEKLDEIRADKEFDISEYGDKLKKLDQLTAKALNILNSLITHVKAINKEVMKKLRLDYGPNELSPRELTRLYANQIKNRPFSHFFFLEYRSDLSIQRLKESFKKPIDVLEFAGRHSDIFDDKLKNARIS